MDHAAYDPATRTVTVHYTGALGGSLLRFLARGSGPQPLLGANRLEFNYGRDFVYTHERS